MPANRFNSRLDALVNRLTGLGGRGDKGNAVAVDIGRTPVSQPARDTLARHEGYAASWLDRSANEATLTGWYIEDLSNSRRFTALRQKERDLGLQWVMYLAFWSAMRDGGSLVFMATRRSAGGQRDLNTPLGADEEIVALHHFDKGEFTPLTWDVDIRSPNFRRPRLWSISPTLSGDIDSGSRGARAMFDVQSQLARGVHWTRVLYIPGRPLTNREKQTNEGIDGSVFDPTWDTLKDQRSVDQGGAVLAQELMQSVLKVAGLEKLDESELADALIRRLQTLSQAKGLLGTLLLRSDDEFVQKTNSASGYKDLKGGARASWAAVTRMPETIAYGATPGGLNTDGEAGRKAWDRELSNMQKLRLKAPLEYLYGILMRSVDAPEDWRLVFHDLGTLTVKERAEIRNTNALTDKVNITAGVYSAEFVRKHRFGPDGYLQELPPVNEVDTPPQPGTSLSGPQMRGLIEVQTQVAKGGISVEAGIANLRFALGVTEEAARALIADHGTSFVVEPEDVVPTEDAVPPSSQDQPGAMD